jgi:hypothetical protein
VSISPANWHNAQIPQHNVNSTKDAFLFHQHLHSNFTADFMARLLLRAPYFGAILPNAVAMKSEEYYHRKNCSALVPKNVGEIDPSWWQKLAADAY